MANSSVHPRRFGLGLMMTMLLLTAALLPAVARGQTADDVRGATGVEAGLAVHLGAGGGELEIGLAEGGRMLVQGLTLEAAAATRGREAAEAAGLAGLVTFEVVEDYSTLPYNDDLVTLLIADMDAVGAAAPTGEEVLRVLSPFGVAYLKKGGTWGVIRKPLPPTMGEWTHHDHAPDGNAQSPDAVVGTPRGVQWWVSSGGTLQSELRLGGGVWVGSGKLSQSEDKTDYLDGRNAFNGLLLWRRAEDGGTSSGRGHQDSTFCTDGRLVYGILDDPRVAKAWDLQTGREVVVYTQGLTNRGKSDKWEFRKTPLSLHHMILGDRLIQASGEGEPDVASLDAATGERQWDWTAPDGKNVALTASADGLLFVALTGLQGFPGYHYGNKLAELDSLVAVDLTTGRTAWTNHDVKGFHSFNLVAADGAVFLASNRVAEGEKGKSDEGPYSHLVRIDAKTGKTAFNTDIPKLGVPGEESWNYKLRYKNGMLLPAFGGAVVAFDAKTGGLAGRPYEMPKKMYQDPPLFCSTIRGTEHGFLTGKFSRFVDLRDGTFSAVSISRSGCDDGSFPAYGQIYAGDDGCGCTSWLRGFISMHSKDYSGFRVADDRRLERGPAYAADGGGGGVGAGGAPLEGWPMLLGGPDRMSYTASRLPSPLTEVGSFHIPSDVPDGPVTADWKQQNDILGRITPPVVVDGAVYLAATHQGRVFALDAATGAVRWSFDAGARVDGPPTVAGGMCYFGARDGRVYAVRAEDGVLAWRFLAAPDHRQIVNSGQLENASPVFGSVMVHDGELFASAGRHNQADGGIAVWRLDPRTGRAEASAMIAGQGNSTQDADRPATHDGQGRIHDLLATTAGGEVLVLNTFAIDPKSLAWASIGRHDEAGPVAEIDQTQPSIMAFAFNNAVGTMDRRSDRIGSKGGNGFLYATRSRKGPVTGERIVRAGNSVFAIKGRGGELYRFPLDADGLPITNGPKDRGEPIAKISGKGSFHAMAATPDVIVIARGADVHLLTHDGKPMQSISFDAQVVPYGLAIADGRLYVTLDNGDVHVLGSDKEPRTE